MEKTIDELIKNIEIKKISGDTKNKVKNITDDSRKIGKGDLFIAKKGTKIDGHNFISLALEKGANFIMAERNPKKEEVGYLVWINVEDTRQANGIIWKNFYNDPLLDIKVIGITGTNGKTSTAFFSAQILENLNKKVALIGTAGSRIGKKEYYFPETDAGTTPSSQELFKFFAKARDEKIEYIVMEVSSHSADQKRIAGIDFSVGIFTNLTQDHLDYHRTMNNYAKAKKSFFEGLSEKSTAVINLDNKYSQYIKKDIKAKIQTFSHLYSADHTYEILKSDDMGIELKLNNSQFKLPLIGVFNSENIVGAICGIMSLGFSKNAIINATESITPPPGRMQIVTRKPCTVIVDYAHTPDAIKKVLMTLKEVLEENNSKGKLIVIFGAGGDRDKTKRSIMGSFTEQLADYSIITSDNPRTEKPLSICNQIAEGFTAKPKKYEIIIDRTDAIQKALLMAQKDDFVAILGKGHEKYQEINGEKILFDDAEVVKKISLNKF